MTVNDSTKQLADVFKALAHPNRLEIYAEVMRRQSSEAGPEFEAGCRLCDFISNLNIGAPTVSHHVKTLVEAGLIHVQRNGKYLACQLDPDMQKRLASFFSDGH